VIKTFTVSSAPLGVDGPKDFDITIRRVGIATTALFDMVPGTEIRVAGFAGEFIPGIVGTESQEEIRFIAGGLGITPFLAIVASKRNAKLRLWWAVRDRDLPFVKNMLCWLQRNGVSNDRVRVFVSGDGKMEFPPMDSLCQIQRRRITMEDLDSYKTSSSGMENHWWICAPSALREQVLGWVEKIGGKGEWETFEY
jgi:ferredoxin-NADP reductase